MHNSSWNGTDVFKPRSSWPWKLVTVDNIFVVHGVFVCQQGNFPPQGLIHDDIPQILEDFCIKSD